jgi:hypothetical protein
MNDLCDSPSLFGPKPLRQVLVRGDGNCGFYSIFESARIQKLGEKLKNLNYRKHKPLKQDDFVYEKLSDAISDINPHPIYNFEQKMKDQETFADFGRYLIRYYEGAQFPHHVYSNALLSVFHQYRDLGLEEWAKMIVTLDTAHIKAAGFKSKDGVSYSHVSLPDEPVFERDRNDDLIFFPAFDKITVAWLDEHAHSFVQQMLDKITLKTTYISAPEIIALRTILASEGIGLATSDKVCNNPTVYIQTYKNHYSAYVPASGELQHKIAEANEEFKQKNDEIEQANFAAATRIQAEYDRVQPVRQSRRQRLHKWFADTYNSYLNTTSPTRKRIRDWTSKKRGWASEKYKSTKKFFGLSGGRTRTSRRKNTTLKHGRSIRPLRPFGDSANAPRRRRKVRSHHSS